MKDLVTVQLNGEPREVTAGLPVAALLDELGLGSVLVEHNGTALFRTEWEAASLQEGDRLEIIRVVAGG